MWSRQIVSMTQYKRPGGPLKGKPVVGLDGRRWYDPFGEEIVFDPKDLEYSKRFWSHNQPPEQRETMIENVLRAGETGFIGMSVDPTGITGAHREKLSALRVLARQMGYNVKQFIFDPRSYTAIASIKKAGYLP